MTDHRTPKTRKPFARNRWALAVPLAAAALLLAACGGASNASSGEDETGRALPVPQTTATAPASSSSQAADAARATSASQPSAEPAAATPQALDFAGTTVVDGTAFEGASLTGKPVVMWFWAPWCTVCRAESPDVAKVAAEFEGKVTFVGIAGRGPLGDMQAFVSETGTGGFTHVADVDGSLWSRFGVVAQPSFVFVTPSGEPQSFTGGLGEKDLRDVANQLLAS